MGAESEDTKEMLIFFFILTVFICMFVLKIQRSNAELRASECVTSEQVAADVEREPLCEKGPTIFPDEYVILDVETTGLSAQLDKIIQISAIKYDSHGKMLECYNTYVNPGIRIPESASRINHITNEMVSAAPCAEDIADAFLTFVGNSLLVGYNVTFDLKFLNNTFGGVFLGREYIDVLPIARECFNLPNYKLQTVSTSVGFESRDFHNSLVDCEAVAAVLRYVNIDISKWIKEFYLREPRYSERDAQQWHAPVSYIEPRGYKYWAQGETARVAGDFEKALSLYDKAKNEGFRETSLYWSYAKIYRKSKEYDLEIAILDEAAISCEASLGETFLARRKHVEELKANAEKRAAEEIQRAQKKREREARRLQEETAKAQRAEIRASQRIRQLTDNGEVVAEFESAAAAGRALGVRAESIRRAIAGEQKHAAGFCWERVSIAPALNSDTEKVTPK